jgi:hypothetical protein
VANNRPTGRLSNLELRQLRVSSRIAHDADRSDGSVDLTAEEERGQK